MPSDPISAGVLADPPSVPAGTAGALPLRGGDFRLCFAIRVLGAAGATPIIHVRLVAVYPD